MASGISRSGYVSKFDDGYPRTRHCRACRQEWPTLEILDRKRLAKMLAKRRMTPADLDLDL